MRNPNLFLLGAGFTKSIYPDAPLNAEVLEFLISSSDKGTVFERLSKEYATDDIETALSRYDLENLASNTEREEINAAIAQCFRKFRFSKEILREKNWLEDFSNSILQENDVIINLNYDCSLEGLLDYHGVWSPQGGYGERIEHPLLDKKECPNPKNILMLKIHGSEHFTRSPYWRKPDRFHLSFDVNETIFPRSAAGKHFSGGLNSAPYIIAPSFVKIPSVEICFLMMQALKAAEYSNSFIIIGCSVRPEDSFLWLLVARFLRNPDWQNRRYIIVDPNGSNIAERISKFWGVNIENIIPIEDRLENSISALGDLVLA